MKLSNYYKNAPYYDDYDPKKGYTQHLALPGRVEQAREFTQIQTIQLDFLSRLGNALLSNGAIIEGCNITIKDRKAIIASGAIFLDGLVRYIYGTDTVIDGVLINVGGIVDINGVGIERIGVRLVTNIITEEDDNSLKDPAVGVINYGQPGAHRVQQLVEFTVNADDAATIYTLQDGEVINDHVTGNSSNVITDTLARRTYDENGNYKISGLNIREKEGDNLAVTITAGKAYVRGYEVEKTAAITHRFREANSTKRVNSEPKYYVGSGDDHLYKLNYYPCAEVLSISAQIRVIDEQVSRTYPNGGRDSLAHDQINRILSIYSSTGSSGTMYIEGRDYALSDDDVDWSINTSGSKEPSVGSSYYVSYIYTKQLERGVDYEIIDKDGAQYIKLINGSNDFNTSYFYVNYNVLLSRRDLVLLDKDGNILTIESKEDKQSLLITPYNMNRDMLELGFVDICPYYDANNNYQLAYELNYTNYRTERLTQAELYALLRRIDDMEYNQAMKDLDAEAEEGESATSLKGIFTDGFIGLTKCDLGYNRDGVVFNACIDYDTAELTIPADTVASSLQIESSNIGRIGRVISAPFTHELAMNQNYATAKMLVNPYSAFNPLSIVELSPPIDNWIETDEVKVNKTEHNTATTTTHKTYSHGWWSTSAVYNLRNYLRTETNTTTTYTGQTTSTSVSKAVQEALVEYMRQRKVKVTGSNFESGQDNIQCFFNETLVPLTPLGSSLAGTDEGTVRADEDGKFEAEFTVPKGVPCGTVSVVLKGSVSQGSAEYTAKGTLQTTTITTTTTYTKNYNVLVETHNLYGSDPLAQSFRFLEDTILTQVGLYFGAKDVNKSVVVQVRNMINGYPGDICYAEVTVNPKDVITSSDGSAETIVKFNQPIYCTAGEFYCFTILSDSNAYEMFYCNLGERDILTREIVTSNPNNGVMFSSANANTWTAHQASDLKFKLYKAHYTGNGSILFSKVTVADMNRLVLAAEYVDYKNAGVEWYYRYMTSAGTWSDWLTLDSYVLRSLDEVASEVQLKAELTIKYNTSPFLADDCINLISFIDGTDATYVSREIYFSEPYTKLKVACQFYVPVESTACGFDVYYMSDGKNWTKLTSEPEVSKVDDEFQEYVWEEDVASSNSYRIRIDMWTKNVFYRPRARKLRSILKY